MPQTPQTDSDESQQTADVMDVGLRNRLEFLVKKSSQADIARRVGLSRNNVNRYLRGVKIPASVCTALVQKLGVNPVWLMTGEGVPFAGEVTDGVADTASNLLEVVRAMNSVAAMKLGSIAGKERHKALRELNDNLQRHEELQVRLRTQFQPFFGQLLEDLQAALTKRDFGQAEYLEKAALQVARVCEDEQLQARLAKYRAVLEGMLRDNADGAIELAKEHLWRHFVHTVQVDSILMGLGADLSALLITTDRYIDAQRIARAVYALSDNQPLLAPARGQLLLYDGVCDATLGDVTRGLEKVREGYSVLPQGSREHLRYLYLRMMLLAGAADVHDAMAADHELGDTFRTLTWDMQAACMLEYVMWLEDQEILKKAVSVYGLHGCKNDADVGLQWQQTCARYMDMAWKQPGPKAGPKLVEKFLTAAQPHALKHIPAPIGELRLAVTVCQLFRLCGNTALAAKKLVETDRLFKLVPADRTVRVLLRAAHYRNAQDLGRNAAASPEVLALAVQAQQFFETYTSRGFLAFRRMQGEVARAPKG